MRMPSPTNLEWLILYGRDVAPIFRAVAHGVPFKAAAIQQQRRNERAMIKIEAIISPRYGLYYGELYERERREEAGR